MVGVALPAALWRCVRAATARAASGDLHPFVESGDVVALALFHDARPATPVVVGVALGAVVSVVATRGEDERESGNGDTPTPSMRALVGAELSLMAMWWWFHCHRSGAVIRSERVVRYRWEYRMLQPAGVRTPLRDARCVIGARSSDGHRAPPQRGVA